MRFQEFVLLVYVYNDEYGDQHNAHSTNYKSAPKTSHAKTLLQTDSKNKVRDLDIYVLNVNM